MKPEVFHSKAPYEERMELAMTALMIFSNCLSHGWNDVCTCNAYRYDSVISFGVPLLCLVE